MVRQRARQCRVCTASAIRHPGIANHFKARRQSAPRTRPQAHEIRTVESRFRRHRNVEPACATPRPQRKPMGRTPRRRRAAAAHRGAPAAQLRYSTRRARVPNQRLCIRTEQCTERVTQIHRPPRTRNTPSRATDWISTAGPARARGITRRQANSRSHEFHRLVPPPGSTACRNNNEHANVSSRPKRRRTVGSPTDRKHGDTPALCAGNSYTMNSSTRVRIDRRQIPALPTPRQQPRARGDTPRSGRLLRHSAPLAPRARGSPGEKEPARHAGQVCSPRAGGERCIERESASVSSEPSPRAGERVLESPVSALTGRTIPARGEHRSERRRDRPAVGSSPCVGNLVAHEALVIGLLRRRAAEGTRLEGSLIGASV